MILSASVAVLLLIRSGLSADTQKLGSPCGDGSFAIRERAATTSMGNETWSCASAVNVSNGELADTDSERRRPPDFDLCHATCKIYCEKPVLNGSPNLDDCLALASYYAGAGEFIIEPLKYVVWEYKTCRVTQYNQLKNPKQRIRYCFDQDHWAGVVSRISSQCESNTSGSHGGSCYFYDSLHYSSITLEKA